MAYNYIHKQTLTIYFDMLKSFYKRCNYGKTYKQTN